METNEQNQFQQPEQQQPKQRCGSVEHDALIFLLRAHAERVAGHDESGAQKALQYAEEIEDL